MNDDMPYAEVYDRLMEAEDTLARIRSLLAPTVVRRMVSEGERRQEIEPTHIKARHLRSALYPDEWRP